MKKNSIDMNTSVPKVSVFMMAYNQASFIKQALDSVLAQETDFSVEIIVGEDCSTDGTRDIVIEGAEKDMDASADVTVEYVDYDFHRHHDKRKVHITIVLKFWARVITTTEMDVYALGPVTEVNQFEVNSGSTSEAVYSSGVFGGESTSATQTGGGDIEGYGSENILVTGQDSMYGVDQGYMYGTDQGFTPTAGTMMGVSGTATITGNSVNIRTGPGTNFPIVTKVNTGDIVTIKEQAFGWYKVVLPDGATTGWVASWLVNTGNGVPAKPKG